MGKVDPEAHRRLGAKLACIGLDKGDEVSCETLNNRLRDSGEAIQCFRIHDVHGDGQGNRAIVMELDMHKVGQTF